MEENPSSKCRFRDRIDNGGSRKTAKVKDEEFHEVGSKASATKTSNFDYGADDMKVGDYIPLENANKHQPSTYIESLAVADSHEDSNYGDFRPLQLKDKVDWVHSSSQFGIASSANKEDAVGETKKMIKEEVTEKPEASCLHCMEGVIQKRHPIYLKDIARGCEELRIPLVNEGGGALELPSFMYIKKNMVHKNAHVDFSQARISDDSCCQQCYGDCLSSALPCACAGETRGEFAYTNQGILKEDFLDECIAMSFEPERKHFYYCEVCPLQNDLNGKKSRRIKPCKGHLTRKFIKECWSKCGCSRKCGNRVVQRGIQVALQVFATPEGKGWGVRSVNGLKKGTFVCEYIGEIVTNQELYERNTERAAKHERHTYPVLLDADWGSERILKDEEALCLDATEFGNVGRFVNHRCHDPNLIEIPVEVETPDHHYYHLAFFTIKDIKPMEELTWDYGIAFDDKYHPVKAFRCKCGSSFCRDRTKP